ncbi:MAG: PIG-L family deacetylase [Acidimicrobiia bacterium]|jgi:N-acetyl-1-D-myo-inositol-2-amino-2-deoxy-alpha-D-glucopyranoside deacetylase
MPGLMAFHAHPDDEVISTGGTLSRYAEAGEQVVVVTATDGAEGEIHNYEQPEAIRPRLAEVRAGEVRSALDILGVDHHEFLGYRDSGMMGTDANRHPEAFWQADFMDATARLIRLIRRYRPEVMLVYDPFGGYGHPDHINVHRIGVAAYIGVSDLSRFPLGEDEEAWEPSKLYWTAWARSRVVRFAEMRHAMGMIDDEELERARSAGVPDRDVTAWIDVTDRVDRKERALRAHRSQIPEDWFLISVPDEVKPEVLGREAFVRVFSRVEAPDREDDLFAGLR